MIERILTEGLIPLISTLLGGLLALSGGYLQQHFSKKERRNELLRSKLEEMSNLSLKIKTGIKKDKEAINNIKKLNERKYDDSVETDINKLYIMCNMYMPKTRAIHGYNSSGLAIRELIFKEIHTIKDVEEVFEDLKQYHVELLSEITIEIRKL